MPISFLREAGYPFFICIASGWFTSLNSIFLAQTLLFLGAGYVASRAIAVDGLFSIVSLIAASRWLRLSEQTFRVDKWSLPAGRAAFGTGGRVVVQGGHPLAWT